MKLNLNNMPELNMLSKNNIRSKSLVGFSEDRDNGEFYSIYDFDMLYELFLEKAEIFMRARLPRVMDYYPNNSETINNMLNEDIREEFRKYMNE